MYWLKQNKKYLYILLLILIAVIPAIFPLLQKGLFITDDAEWMIIRLSAFYQALSDGQFPVRFLGRLNNEYGYPVATFLYPAFLYIGSVMHLFKIGVVEATKIILGLSMISSFVFAYLWLRKFFDKSASFVGSLFYLYAPYHLFDLYKRGSVGEILALAILPFIFWQLERKNIFFSAIGIGLLIISHNSLALFFLPIIALYMFFGALNLKQKRAKLYQYISTLILGIGLSAFFIIPAVLELKYTNFPKIKISDPFEYFASTELVGYSTLFILFIASSLFIFKRKVYINDYRPILFLVIGLISIFFATNLSAPLWSFLPAGFIQFPFRLLSITIFSLTFIAAFIASYLKGIYKNLFILSLVVFLINSTYQFTSKIQYFDKGEGFYITNNDTTTVHGEYMPIWVKEKPIQRASTKAEIVKGDGKIKNLVYDNKKINMAVDSENDLIIQVNTIYWPGWEARVDGKKSNISYNNPMGLIRISIPKGEHEVSLSFGETQLRLISDIISLISLAAVLILARKKA